MLKEKNPFISFQLKRQDCHKCPARQDCNQIIHKQNSFETGSKNISDFVCFPLCSGHCAARNSEVVALYLLDNYVMILSYCHKAAKKLALCMPEEFALYEYLH